ncbi:MAG: hypothetical protein E6F96_00090 [Actinobacteria bacterium]|nr:MAG: hypothetical protein E6F96_00090 [Actinomycetota bacterium]
MSGQPLTRRSFLAAGAGAMAAGGLARPAAPLASALGLAPPRLSQRWLGAVPAGGRTITLPPGADLLGLEWAAPAEAGVQLRVGRRGGRWSGWVTAGACCAWLEGASASAPARLIAGPVWTGGASALQLRATHPLAGVRLHIVDVSGGVGAHRLALAREMLGSASALQAAAPTLHAGPGQPRILARAGWARGVARPRVAPAYGVVRMAFVHHTETPNGYLAAEVPAMLRAIFVFHRDVRGWNDIGYNFVIDAFGRIFEARAGGIDEPVVGAQAGGFNLESTGVAVLGAFSSRRTSVAAGRALQRLLAWKLALHGVSAQGRARVRVNPAGAVYSRFPAGAHVWLPHIAGHRDGDATDCPGDALYHQLPAIRRRTRRLAPSPTRATLVLGAAAPPAPAPGAPAQPSAGAAFSLSGRLALLDGTAIAGAPIRLQLRSVARHGEAVNERTLAEARTDAAGGWSLPLGPASSAGREVWLRALYAGAVGQPSGAGAAVSDPLRVPASLIASLEAAAPSEAASAPPAR